jgi:Zn-dependent protease
MHAPETPGPARKITPVQWIGLAAVGLLLAYQLGLFGGSGLFGQGPEAFVPFLIAIVLAVTIHEFSHALVAYLFGDTLAKRLGRLTLNPLAHLDPMGSLLFLFAGFGWGKPVPIDPNAMRNPGLGWALSSVAGPVSNFLAAITGVLVLVGVGETLDPTLANGLNRFIAVNVGLGVFNLIPLPPLDGFGFVFGLSPNPVRRALAPVATYGPFILLGLLFLPTLVPGMPSPLSGFMGFAMRLVFQALNAVANAL